MKTVKSLLLSVVAISLMACGGESEEELVGNWTTTGVSDFGGTARGYASCFVIGNKGYVCGGYNGYKTPRKDVWVVTVDDGGGTSWTQADSMPVPFQRGIGFSVNGKGYVGTGWDGDEGVYRKFYEYDPSKDDYPNTNGAAWREVAPLPVNARARYSAVAFVVNGKAFVGTGYTAGSDKDYLSDFWRFNPPSASEPEGSWTQVASTGKKRGNALAFVLADADGNEWAYLCTGRNSSGTVYDFQCFDGENWKNLRPIRSYDEDDDFDDEYGSYLMRTDAVGFTMKGTGSMKGYITAGDGQTTWEYEPPVYGADGVTRISGDVWTQRTAFVGVRTGAFALSFPGKGKNGDNLVLIGAGEQAGYFRDDVRTFDPEAENNTNDD